MIYAERIERIRDEINEALDSGDADALERCIEEYKKYDIPEEEDELKMAEEYLPIWQMNEGL